jgi:hypothetical protein
MTTKKIIKTNISERFAKDVNFCDCYKIELYENINKIDFLTFAKDYSTDSYLLEWLNEDNFKKYLEYNIDIPENIKKIYNKTVKKYSFVCELWFDTYKNNFIYDIRKYLNENYKNLITDIHNPINNICSLILDYNYFNYNIFSVDMLQFIEKKLRNDINIDHLWLEGRWSNNYVSQGLKDFQAKRKYSKNYYDLKRSIIKDIYNNTEYGKYFEFDIILENVPDGKNLIHLLRKLKLKNMLD